MFIQRGLQVNEKPTALSLQVAAGGQNRWAGHAKMGEQQLAKILIEELSFGAQQLYRHISKTQALHGGAVLPCRLQRHQTSLLRNDGMAQLRSHGVAVAGGAGSRIGKAAGRQNHPVRCVIPGSTRNARHHSIFRENTLDPVGFDLHMETAQLLRKAVQNGLGFIRRGKYPVSPLRFQFTAALTEKSHGF